ncbi:MAG: hypothetical protein COB35_07480 [Gammaproteobacteria bacterium]|nr:MAG: hypothetical protein COB35_07480 [Gammaproteobacteria bacterium]
MNKTFYCFISIFGLIFACSPAKNHQNDSVVPLSQYQCLATQSHCNIETKQGVFSVTFDRKNIKAEAPFKLLVSYKGTLQLKQVTGFMEGKTMFMGKIPLFFSQENKSHYIAETMVVACTEPSMVWRMWFTADLYDNDMQTEVKQGFFIDFSSEY